MFKTELFIFFVLMVFWIFGPLVFFFGPPVSYLFGPLESVYRPSLVFSDLRIKMAVLLKHSDIVSQKHPLFE